MDRCRSPAFFVAQRLQPLLVLGYPEDVSGLANIAAVPESPQLALSQTFDREGIPAHEMHQLLERLRLAGSATRTPGHDLVRFALHRPTAGRALLREFERCRRLRSTIEIDVHDLRDHVARALDRHEVALADVETIDLIAVVKCGPPDHHAAHGHGLETRDRCQGAGSADLHVD